ncbi:hypothetical protein O1M54_06380 [Streptomyces diastatochromogenes]|nr:hypothetical protein [Streptomyces diastatochromogenes]
MDGSAPRCAGGRPPARAAYRILLRDHREAVLARLADALPVVLHAAGHPDGRQMTAPLVDWARTWLTAAVTGPRPGIPEPALPSLHLELTVATLLLECTSASCPTCRPATSPWRPSATPLHRIAHGTGGLSRPAGADPGLSGEFTRQTG